MLCTHSLNTQQWIPKRIIGMDYPHLARAARIEGRVEVLCRINPDGSYVQTFTGKYKTDNSGKWSQDKTHLLLGDALVFTDPFGKPLEKPEKENIGLGTAWYFGRLILDANPDQGFMYEKQH